MVPITDEYVKQMIAATKSYCICILRATSKRREVGADKIAWEHGRRNFQLKAEGIHAADSPGVFSRSRGFDP